MKINKCGCGGEGELVEGFLAFAVQCQKCACRVDIFSTADYAITVWNKANPSEVEIRRDQLGKILEILDKLRSDLGYNPHWRMGIASAMTKIKEEFGG